MPEAKKIMVKVSKGKNENPKADKVEKVESKSNNLELTKAYVQQKEKMEDNLESKSGKDFTEKTQGIAIKKENMSAKPIMFKRKVIKFGGDTGSTRIMSDDGKSVKYEGHSNMQSTKDALRENESQSKDTNNRRDKNANFYNINSGAKKNLDDEDKATLVKNGKAIVKK